MKDQVTRVRYPVTSLTTGPIETVSFVRSCESLSGFFLDYALACVCDYKAITLDFLPGLRPWRVLVGQSFDILEEWSPTKKPDLAKQLVEMYLNRDVPDGSIASLIEIVRTKIGENVVLMKPTQEFIGNNQSEV